MKFGAVAILIGLALGGVAGWLLRGHRGIGDQQPNVVDTVLINNPTVTAKLDTALRKADSAIKASKAKDNVILTNKARADFFARRIAERHRAPRENSTQPRTSPSSGDTVIPTIIDTTYPDSAIVVGPETIEICKEDLHDRTEESKSLRIALSNCMGAKSDLELQLDRTASILASAKAWRADTFPDLIKKERSTPRECKENWVLFEVGCATSGAIKLGTVLTVLGTIIAVVR